MPARCDRPGLSFQYPENWSIEEDDPSPEIESVTVQSPGSGFLTISRHTRAADPNQLADAAVKAVRDEYPTAETHRASQLLAGRDAVGYDVHFDCLDLMGLAKVRSLRFAGATYIIFAQAEDREFDAIEPVFMAITVSLLNELTAGAVE